MVRMARRLAFSVLLLGLAPAAALAGPLLPEQCEKLIADVAALDKAGVKAILEKGPAAARSSLTKELRDQIRSYLDGLGQLRFRCPNDAPFVTLKPEPPDDPAEAGAAIAPIEAGSPGITLPPGVAAAVVAPVLPKKPAEPKAGAAKPAVVKQVPAKTDAAKGDAAKAPPKASPGKALAPSAVTPQAAPVSPVAAPASSQPTGSPTPPKPKPAPKAKSDDAFRPAQPTEGKAP
jgi:hypothetical protein